MTKDKIHCDSDEIIIVCNSEKIIYIGDMYQEAISSIKNKKGFKILTVPFGDYETLIN